MSGSTYTATDGGVERKGYPCERCEEDSHETKNMTVLDHVGTTVPPIEL